jgi:uncharacterized RDD family membrane protein YckC
MNQRWTIETPERITFSYRIAGAGSRLAAYLIDIIVQFAFFLLVLLAMVLLSVNYSPLTSEFSGGFFLLMYFLLQWWYYLLFEWFFDGRTPGKMAQKIRVIRDDGRGLDFPVLVLRNYLRAVDHFPIVPLMGALSMLISKTNRRLGDLAAGTLVVDDARGDLELPRTGLYLDRGEQAVPISIDPPPGLRLNENQLELIRDFIRSLDRDTVAGTDSTRELAAKVAEALNIDLPENGEYRRFLEEVYIYHAIPE